MRPTGALTGACFRCPFDAFRLTACVCALTGSTVSSEHLVERVRSISGIQAKVAMRLEAWPHMAGPHMAGPTGLSLSRIYCRHPWTIYDTFR